MMKNIIDFIKCEEKEVVELTKEHDLLLSWAGDRCHKVTKNNLAVALIEAELIKNNSYFEIDNFEVFEKRKGMGGEIVKDILSQGVDVCLYANDNNSKKFWERYGFQAEDDGTGEAKKHFYRHINVR